MKKFSVIILLLALLMCGCASGDAAAEVSAAPAVTASAETPAPSAEPSPTPIPIPEEIMPYLGMNEEAWIEKHFREWMIGRLIIPEADINVALFIHGEGDDVADIRQNVCDGEDSAILYSDGVGNVVADHNNQGFINLPKVRLGDRAYILAGDCIVTLECDLVCDGINTGKGVTDKDGNWVTINEDFTLYTCGEDWVNVKIAGFKEIEEIIFDEESLPKVSTEEIFVDGGDAFDRYADIYSQ